MIKATSTTFSDTEFGDFLYAPVGAEGSEMPVSVLSALARLNVDPWKEAAELSRLPRDRAQQRLTSLLERLPKARWAERDSGTIAHRLVGYLPEGIKSVRLETLPKAGKPLPLVLSPIAKLTIAAAFCILTMITLAHREPASIGGDHLTPPPVSTPVSK